MQLAISTNWNSRLHPDGETLVAECLRTGVGAIELGYALTHRQAEDIVRLCTAGDIAVVSVHAFCPVPMGAPSGHPELFSICDRFPAFRRRAGAELLKTARFAASVGAKTVVLHAGRAPVHRAMRALAALAEAGRRADPRYARRLARLLDLRDRRAPPVFKRLRQALQTLLPAFEDLGITLALENLPTWDAVPNEVEMTQLLQEFPTPALAYWHDLGHGQVRENLGFIHHASIAARLASRTAGCHVHDVHFPTQDHLMPPHGDLRFDRFRDLASRSMPAVLEPAPGTPPEMVREAVDFLRQVWA